MSGLIRELFRTELYKRSQGRYTRLTTLYALLVVLGYAAFRISEGLTGVEFPAAMAEYHTALRYGIAACFFAFTGWIAFRVVQMPQFANFLISVEAEMKKVYWPSRDDVYRASIVVLVVLLIMAGSIFVFDMILRFIATKIGIMG